MGIVAGVAFGASFFAASALFGHSALPAYLADPEAYVATFTQSNDFAERRGQGRPLTEPVIVAEGRFEAPRWFEPFWAGLSAALGQAITIFVWFHRPAPRRTRLHLRGGVATGLMWVGVCSVLFAWWEAHVGVLGRANFFAAAFGRPVAPDPLLPFYPFGLAAAAFAVLLALEPWRGIQRSFRCGRWVAASVTTTLAFGGLLALAAQGMG